MNRTRLTGGAARGRVLPVPVPSGVRPTSARVREALFSMVGQDLAGVRVLDAFGGTGLLALEAWSRGGSVTSVDRSREACGAIRQNAEHLGADLEIICGDVHAITASLGLFDLVLADPPYRDDPGEVMRSLAPLSSQWLVIETDESVAAPAPSDGLAVDRRRVYGGTALAIYRRPSAV